MADGNKEENPSADKACEETRGAIDEDEEEIDFPFDLSEEWMVIDVDEDDEDEVQRNDSSSKGSPSYDEKDCAGTSKSQAKEGPTSHAAKPSDSKSQKESTEKPKDVKKEISHRESPSAKKAVSTRSTSQTSSKPIASQENKGDSKKDTGVPLKSPSDQSTSNKKDTSVKKKPTEDPKASKSLGKSMSAVDCPKESNKASSNANAKVINERPTSRHQTRQQTSRNQSPKSSIPNTSASPTKTPISQKTLKLPDKNSSGKTNSSANETAKSSASSTKPPSSQMTPKSPVRASSGKTSNTSNQTSKSPHAESSASSAKQPSSPMTPKPSGKASSGKTSSSAIQTSMSAAKKTTQAQKVNSNTAPSKNVSNIEKFQESTSQSQASDKSKGDTSTKEKTTISKSDNKSTSGKVTSTSASSACPVSVSASKTEPSKDRIITSETETKTLTKSSVSGKEPPSLSQSTTSGVQIPSSAAQATSKAHGISTSAKKDVQKNNSSLHLKSPDSKKFSQGDASRAADLKPVEKKSFPVEHGKQKSAQQKSAQQQVKAARNTDATGEIAAAMGAGNIGLCDIQVHDLDSVVKSGEKKTVQIKPAHSAGPNPKKRPSQSNCENMMVKKAKYEEKDMVDHSQESRPFSGKQKDDIKGSKPDEKELSAQKQSTKRIVRRFHRATQTITKVTANQPVQCSLGQPPSGSSSSSKKQQKNSGIQCRIAGHFEDVMCKIRSQITPAVDTINQEVFKAVLAFDASSIHRDIVTPGTFKYGLRLGQVTQSDMEKNFFKDNCIKKADGYSISFWKKDCGVVDLLFYEQENFVSVINQIRKSRLETRYLCVSMVKTKSADEENDAENLWDYLKATVIFDQNFVSTGYLSYYKTPIWSKPKVDEFITMHNVPSGIPLSFLNLVIPDAITVLMRDVKAKYTRKGGGVRLGMSRKNGRNVFLKLFKQVLINDFPVVLTQGLSDKKDIPEVQALSKIVTELEKLERERLKEKACPYSVTAVPRDINDGKKKTKAESGGSPPGKIPSPSDNLARKETVKGSQEAPLEVDSDLSDISELSFNANFWDNSRDDMRSSKVKQQERPLKKVEPKKSLKVTMGSKLLSRARNKMHQVQNRRQEKSSGKKPVTSQGKRRSPDRHLNRTRAHSPRRLGMASSRPLDVRRDDSRQRDEHLNRRSDSLQNERLRNNRSIERGSFDRSSAGSGSRHGQRGRRDLDHSRARLEHSPETPLRRPRSHNRSPEREVLVRGPNRMPKGQERHGVGERVRMREGEGDNYMEYSHQSPSVGNPRDRRISLENPNELLSDLQRSSEDLRSILDARKPRQVRMSPSPRRHGSAERIRFGSPGGQRRSRSPERRKRPISRSPSPAYRKVLIGRRSLSPSPRKRVRRQQSGGSPQGSRPGMDVMAKEVMRSKASDSRSAQAHKQPGTGEKTSKEESMRISKSLFVKLLTNALHGEGGEVLDESSRQIAERYSPHREDTGRMLSQIRGQESSKDERPFRNVASYGRNYSHSEQRRPDFDNDRGRYGQSGTSKGNFEQGSTSGGDVRPIPPPVLPPILTSSSSNFPVNRPREGDPSPSSSQVPQGVWAVPSSSSFTFPMSMPGNVRPPAITDRPPPPMPPPQNLPPFNPQPQMVFPNAPPPFQPPRGPMPNMPQSMPPPRPPMWQNRPPGPF